ncbi:hypothetical protein E3P94_02364 [Wallemia ichthyophaga]|nr:hypothetical protein E3P98_02341 [Wallemia ichthyophaga]TIA98849.1 hypothetical protein E3P95_02307 [Wallemia ichthyophaga]TIB00069.1 hypothetical protein E3P94_02364 [Wallemia ichthyophaga]
MSNKNPYQLTLMTTPNKRKNYPPIPTPNRARESQPPTPSRRTPRGTRILPPTRAQQTPIRVESNFNSTSDRETPRNLLRMLTKAPGVPKPSPPVELPAQTQQTPTSRRQSTSFRHPPQSAQSAQSSHTPQQSSPNIPPTVRRSSAYRGIKRTSMPPPPTPHSLTDSPASIVTIESPVSVNEYWQQHRPISRSPSNTSAFDDTEAPELARRERAPADFRLSMVNRSSFGMGLGADMKDDSIQLNSGDSLMDDPSLHLDNTSTRKSAQIDKSSFFYGDDKTLEIGNESSLAQRQPPVMLDEVDGDDILLDDNNENELTEQRSNSTQDDLLTNSSNESMRSNSREERRSSIESARLSESRPHSTEYDRDSTEKSLSQHPSQSPHSDQSLERQKVSPQSSRPNESLSDKSNSSLLSSRSSRGSKRPRESDGSENAPSARDRFSLLNQSPQNRDTQERSSIINESPHEKDIQDRSSILNESQRERMSQDRSSIFYQSPRERDTQDRSSAAIEDEKNNQDSSPAIEDAQDEDPDQFGEPKPIEGEVPFENEIPADNESDRGRGDQDRSSVMNPGEQPEGEDIAEEEPVEDLVDMLPTNDMIDAEVAEGGEEADDAWEEDEVMQPGEDLPKDDWNLAEPEAQVEADDNNVEKRGNVADDSMAIRPRSKSVDDEAEADEEDLILDPLLRKQKEDENEENGEDPDVTITQSNFKGQRNTGKSRSTNAKARGVRRRLPNITQTLIKKHFERFMNQNRSGPKLAIEKGTEEVLMERCMEYIEALTDGAEQMGRPNRITEGDMMQVMKLHGFISDKQPVQTVARRILSTEMSIEYDNWAMEWSSSLRYQDKEAPAKKGKGGAKQGKKSKKLKRRAEYAEEVAEEDGNAESGE